MPGAELPLVIVNPASRGGRGAGDWPRAASAFRSQFGALECRFTERSGHAVDIARQEAGRGRERLVSFGGDGTISEIARGILLSERRPELLILPHGTGGDFLRSIGLPAGPAEAARALRRGRTAAIDLGRIRFGDGSSRSFINSASFGLAAEVARRVNRSRKRQGPLAFASATLRAAASYRPPEVWLGVEGAPPRRLPITTVSLHNGRYFGGGMQMAPGASLTDGLLETVLVRRMGLTQLAQRSPLLYWGAHLGLDQVEHRQLTRLEAEPVRPGDHIPVEIDGETDFCLPARFEILPRALRLRIPAGSEAQPRPGSPRG